MPFWMLKAPWLSKRLPVPSRWRIPVENPSGADATCRLEIDVDVTEVDNVAGQLAVAAAAAGGVDVAGVGESIGGRNHDLGGAAAGGVEVAEVDGARVGHAVGESGDW